MGQQLIQEEVLHSFDLANSPSFRARLVRLADREYLLLVTMHQIICDGWSLGVLVDELVALCDAFRQERRRPCAPLTFSTQTSRTGSGTGGCIQTIVTQLDYWREQLRDPLPVMRFARGRPRSTIDEFRTARRELALPASLAEATKLFSNREGGTSFMTLVAALKDALALLPGSG